MPPNATNASNRDFYRDLDSMYAAFFSRDANASVNGITRDDLLRFRTYMERGAQEGNSPAQEASFATLRRRMVDAVSGAPEPTYQSPVQNPVQNPQPNPTPDFRTIDQDFSYEYKPITFDFQPAPKPLGPVPSPLTLGGRDVYLNTYKASIISEPLFQNARSYKLVYKTADGQEHTRYLIDFNTKSEDMTLTKASQIANKAFADGQLTGMSNKKIDDSRPLERFPSWKNRMGFPNQ